MASRASHLAVPDSFATTVPSEGLASLIAKQDPPVASESIPEGSNVAAFVELGAEDPLHLITLKEDEFMSVMKDLRSHLRL